MFPDSYGGGVPGLRRFSRGHGALWGAVECLQGSCQGNTEGVIGTLRELWVGCHGKGKGKHGENKGQPVGWKGNLQECKGEFGLRQGNS